MLPQIFTQKPDPVIRNVDALVVILEDCGVSERVSLLQVFGMIAKIKPTVSSIITVNVRKFQTLYSILYSLNLAFYAVVS